MSQLFESGGQSFGASTLASVLPMNIQDRLPLESPCSPRDSQASSPALHFKSISSSVLSPLYGPTLTSVHDYWENTALIIWIFVGKVVLLLFNMLSRFVIAFLPRSKRPLISWLQTPDAVILEPKKIKSITVSSVSQIFAIN